MFGCSSLVVYNVSAWSLLLRLLVEFGSLLIIVSSICTLLHVLWIELYFVFWIRAKVLWCKSELRIWRQIVDVNWIRCVASVQVIAAVCFCYFRCISLTRVQSLVRNCHKSDKYQSSFRISNCYLTHEQSYNEIHKVYTKFTEVNQVNMKSQVIYVQPNQLENKKTDLVPTYREART